VAVTSCCKRLWGKLSVSASEYSSPGIPGVPTGLAAPVTPAALRRLRLSFNRLADEHVDTMLRIVALSPSLAELQLDGYSLDGRHGRPW
jgi:hypothetical protein